MKLPDDRRDRIKVLVLIGIGVVLALYGGFMGIVSPVVRLKKERLQRIEDLQAKIQKAKSAVSRMAGDFTANSNAVSELVDVTDRQNFILLPRLGGNYILGASETLENQAKKAEVGVEAVTEGGISQIPQPASRKAAPAFKSYTVRVSLQCGIHDLMRLLTQVEESNPYLCVSSLTITPQGDKPDKHSVSLEIQWPIWADTGMPALLNEQLKKIAEAQGDPSQQAAPAAAPPRSPEK